MEYVTETTPEGVEVRISRGGATRFLTWSDFRKAVSLISRERNPVMYGEPENIRKFVGFVRGTEMAKSFELSKSSLKGQYATKLQRESGKKVEGWEGMSLSQLRGTRFMHGQFMSVAPEFQSRADLELTKTDTTKTPFLTFGVDREPTYSKGVVFVTPEEAQQLKGTSLPFWEVQSKDLFGAVEEGAFASQVKQSVQTPLPRSQGSFEFDVQQIQAGRLAFQQYQDIKTEFQESPESFVGKTGVETTDDTITLTPKYFEESFLGRDFQKEGLLFAKERFASLPRIEQSRLYGGGLMVGGSQAVVGLGEFGLSMFANFGVQQTEGFKPFEFKQVRFGGLLGDISSIPRTQASVGLFEDPLSFGEQKLQSPEFLGSGMVIAPFIWGQGSGFISNIRRSGLKTGSLETIGTFSPLTIKSGLYYPRVSSETQIRATSFKSEVGGDINKIVFGRGALDPVDIVSFQKMQTGETGFGGRAFTLTETPFVNIRAGGGVIETGTRLSGTRSVLTGKPSESGKVVERLDQFTTKDILDLNFRGTISKSYSQPRFDAIFGKQTRFIDFFEPSGKVRLYKTGGISKELSEGITGFAGGRRFSIRRLEYGTFKTNVDDLLVKTPYFIERPTGRYRIKPSILGKEYDLNILFGGERVRTSILTGKKRKPRPTTQQELDFSVSSIQASLDLPKLPTGKTTKPLITSPTKTKTTSETILGQPQIMTQRLRKSLDYSFTAKQQPTQLSRTELLSGMGIKSRLHTRTLQQPALRELQGLRMKQGLKLRSPLKQKLEITSPVEFSFDYGFRPVDFGRSWFGFPSFYPSLKFHDKKPKAPKPKRKFRRDPSLIAGELGWTTSKIRPSEITGLVSRDILTGKKSRRRK